MRRKGSRISHLRRPMKNKLLWGQTRGGLRNEQRSREEQKPTSRQMKKGEKDNIFEGVPKRKKGGHQLLPTDLDKKKILYGKVRIRKDTLHGNTGEKKGRGKKLFCWRGGENAEGGRTKKEKGAKGAPQKKASKETAQEKKEKKSSSCGKGNPAPPLISKAVARSPLRKRPEIRGKMKQRKTSLPSKILSWGRRLPFMNAPEKREVVLGPKGSNEKKGRPLSAMLEKRRGEGRESSASWSKSAMGGGDSSLMGLTFARPGGRGFFNARP